VAHLAADRAAALSRIGACGDLLTKADLASPARLTLLRERTNVPDDYSLWKRAAGIYPLSRIPFLSGVREWQQSTLAAFAHAAKDTHALTGWQQYTLASALENGSAMPATSQPVPRDALGIPAMSEQQVEDLARRHAPIFNVEISGAYDRFGTLIFAPRKVTGAGESAESSVDITSPAVYARHDFTRYGKMTLLQLTYTLWFPERPAAHALDLLAGKFTGVMVRMTFAPGGEVILVDSAHACGCYHLFFPSALVATRPAPDTREEWAFVPAHLPHVPVGQRLRVWVASRTHYLLRLDSAAVPESANRYSLTANEAMLKNAAPAGGVGTRSLYQPDGLVAGSARGERFFFWPMGIESAGQMRQWGHHATAFVGRRHFDDAYLIEKYFEIDFARHP
jgi:hypothetical protein